MLLVKIDRLLWPGLIVAVLGLPLVVALLQRVPNINDVEIVDAETHRAQLFVGLGHTTDDRSVSTARKVLWHQPAHGPLAHDEVRLLMTTASAVRVSGELRVAGTECAYRTAPRTRVINGTYLTFTRAGHCPPVVDGWQELQLTISFEGDGRVGLVTSAIAPGALQPDWMLLVPPDAADARPIPVVRGRYADHLGGDLPRRIDLLRYMWNATTSSGIWIVVATALGAIALGACLISPVLPARPFRPALSVGWIALGVALLYTVLVPPLQAPDEPDHVLAFAQVAGRPELADSLATLARRSHFDRIHFRPEERFRPIDIGRPATVAWNDEVFAHAVETRSVTAWWWWKGLAPVAGGGTAARAIWLVRLANAVLFAAAMAAAATLLRAAAGRAVTAPHVIPLALLVIPTLPFFATHVSEFAVLVASYVVAAAAITALFLDGPRTHLLGLPLGLSVAAVLGGGRSGLPFLATIAAVLVGRAMLGSSTPDVRERWRTSLTFWGGLAIGLAPFPVLSTPEFRGGLWPGDAQQPPPWFQWAAELLRRSPWLAGVFVPIGFTIEIALAWCRSRFRGGRALVRSIGAIGSVSVGCVIATTLVASLWMSLPTAPVRELTPVISARDYVLDVLAVAATSFRVTGHDWLLSSSFWGGFGWLETALPTWAVSVPIVMTACAVWLLMSSAGRATSPRAAVWLVVLGSGWVATAAVYAIANFFLSRNLHGRYLIGLYVSVMTVAWSSVAAYPKRATNLGRFWPDRGLVLLVLAATLHAIALGIIVLRYF